MKKIITYFATILLFSNICFADDVFYDSRNHEYTLDTEPTYNMNLPDLQNKEEDCDFYAYTLMTYDCSDAEGEPKLIPVCLERIENLLEKYPKFYCLVNNVSHDGTLLGIEEHTREELEQKLLHMLQLPK